MGIHNFCRSFPTNYQLYIADVSRAGQNSYR